MFSITGLIIVGLIYHSAYGLPDTQIVGGTDAPDGQYPYQVSLKFSYNRTHFCGGAIVDKRYVITAAHCLTNVYNNPANVQIDVGNNHLYAQTTYYADALIPHPDYNNMLHDIGLIKLTKDISFNENTKSIALISNDQNFEHVVLTATGWGRLKDNGQSPSHLQQINLTVFPQSECAETLRQNITDRHVCTLQTEGQGMCNGDSGSPLTYKGELVGIMFFGSEKCAHGFPDVFTKVFYYRSWLNEYINNATESNNAGSNQQLNILFGLFTSYLCIHLFL